MSATLDELRAAGMRIGDDVAIYNCIFDTNYPFLIEIGAHSIITHATVLAHDDSPTLFGRGVVAGRVRIGSRCFVGVGAIVMPGVTIGDGAIVGAHSVVTRDVAAGVVVVGNPAREICTTEDWLKRLDEAGDRKRLIRVSHDSMVQSEAQSDELAMLVRASVAQTSAQSRVVDPQSGSDFAGVTMVDFAPGSVARAHAPTGPKSGTDERCTMEAAASGSSPITVISVREATSTEWDAYWLECPYGTYFQSREWMEVWAKAENLADPPAASLIALSDGTTAILPMSTSKSYKGLVTSHSLSVGGGYGGWLTNARLGPSHASALTRYVGGLGNLQWLTNPVDPFLGAPIKGQVDETQIVSMNGDVDAIARNLTKGHKSAVQKAKRAGVEVRQAETFEDWKKYYAVYNDSLRRWGDRATSFHPFSILEALYSKRSTHVKLWLATHENEIVAGALCLYAKKHVAYWHGAALESAFGLRPVNLLIYEAIVDACQSGYEWFDLGLSGGHAGVAAFKKSFGAASVPCVFVSTQTRWKRFLAVATGAKDRVAQK